MRIAIVRVTLAAGAGFVLAMYVPRALGIAEQWGAAFLALASSIAGWVELALLRRRMTERVGESGLGARYAASLFAAALVAGAAGVAVKWVTSGLHRFVVVGLALGVFGLVYLSATTLLGVPEVRVALRRIRGRR